MVVWAFGYPVGVVDWFLLVFQGFIFDVASPRRSWGCRLVVLVCMVLGFEGRLLFPRIWGAVLGSIGRC